MKLYNDQRNITGKIIMERRKDKKLSRKKLSASLDLLGISINAQELYRIETGRMIIKDFELIAIIKILNIDFNIIKDLIEN